MKVKLANLEDLLKERWLRKRNAEQIVWQTKDGQIIPIKNISDKHLDNIITMIERNQSEEWEYYEALSSIGEIQ